MLRNTLTLLTLTAALGALPAAAQSVPPSAPPPGARVVTLDEALAAAAENNPDIRVIRWNRAQQNARVTQAGAAFDPLLTGGVTRTGLENLGGAPPALNPLTGLPPNPDDPADPYYSSFFTVQSHRNDYRLGVSRPLEWGGSVKLEYEAAKNASSQTGLSLYSGSTLNPSYSAGLTLSWTQPLLGGFGFNSGSQALRQARLGREATLAGDRDKIADLFLSVEQAYWDMLASQEDYRVAVEARDLARRFLDETDARIKAGTVAPIERVTAEAGVAGKEEGVITAENRWRNAQDNFRRLVDPRGGKFAGELWVAPPQTLESPKIDLAAALDAARKARGDRQALSAQLEQAKLRESVARRGRLPRLDLVSSYGTAGATGPVDFYKRFEPSGTVDNAGHAFSGANDQLFGRKLDNWSIGLTFSWSVFNNRGERAAYADAAIDRAKAGAALESYDNGLELQVRQAARDHESAYKRVQAAQANRVLQERKFEAEKIRYDNGLSTSYQVLQFQNDLASARSAESAAISNYELTRARFERATGNYLAFRGVAVADLPAPGGE